MYTINTKSIFYKILTASIFKQMVNRNKPSTNKINNQLNEYKCNKKSTRKFAVKCRQCGHEFEFFEKDLTDRIYRCPECGREEIFFFSNF